MRDDLDQIDTLELDVAALERTLGDASAMTQAFDSELRSVQGSLEGTTQHLGNLERGFSSGLRLSLIHI